MTEREPDPSAEVEHLLALARRSLTGTPPRRNAASLLGVKHAMQRRTRRRRRVGAALGASGLVLCTLLLMLWFRPSAGPPTAVLPATLLRYEVSSGTRSASGQIEASAQGSRIRFSDGTELALASHGRVQVGALSAQGAEVGLERGRVRLDVVKRAGARWSVHAGPYQVHVTGTSFEVEFEPEQRWLELDLLEGSVSVQGPLIDGSLQVMAGQRLLVRPGDAPLLLQRREYDEAGVAPSIPQAPPLDRSGADAGGDSSSGGEAEEQLERASAAPEPAKERAHAPRRRASARTAEPPSWKQQLALSRFHEVIASAELRGLQRVYSEADIEQLAALADAARYARRSDIAKPALLALRQRFLRSRPALEAAFLLARLEESAGELSSANAWYDRYLREDPDGVYAAQALGRKLTLASERSRDDARSVAREYLRRFPDGDYAASAQELAREP